MRGWDGCWGAEKRKKRSRRKAKIEGTSRLPQAKASSVWSEARPDVWGRGQSWFLLWTLRSRQGDWTMTFLKMALTMWCSVVEGQPSLAFEEVPFGKSPSRCPLYPPTLGQRLALCALLPLSTCVLLPVGAEEATLPWVHLFRSEPVFSKEMFT